MMKEYTRPLAELVEFDVEDVILTSGWNIGEGNNDNPMEWSMKTANNNVNDVNNVNLFD